MIGCRLWRGKCKNTPTIFPNPSYGQKSMFKSSSCSPQLFFLASFKDVWRECMRTDLRIWIPMRKIFCSHFNVFSGREICHLLLERSSSIKHHRFENKLLQFSRHCHRRSSCSTYFTRDNLLRTVSKCKGLETRKIDWHDFFSFLCKRNNPPGEFGWEKWVRLLSWWWAGWKLWRKLRMFATVWSGKIDACRM